MSWASAWAFFLLIPTAVLFAYIIYTYGSRTPFFKFSSLREISKLSGGLRVRTKYLPMTLKLNSLI